MIFSSSILTAGEVQNIHLNQAPQIERSGQIIVNSKPEFALINADVYKIAKSSTQDQILLRILFDDSFVDEPEAFTRLVDVFFPVALVGPNWKINEVTTKFYSSKIFIIRLIDQNSNEQTITIDARKPIDQLNQLHFMTLDGKQFEKYFTSTVDVNFN